MSIQSLDWTGLGRVRLELYNSFYRKLLFSYLSTGRQDSSMTMERAYSRIQSYEKSYYICMCVLSGTDMQSLTVR